MSGGSLRLANLCESVAVRTGQLVAWLTVLMIGATFAVVVLRYFFSLGYIWLQEVGVYLHALVFLLGAAYTLARDEHVRVDIFYRKMSARWQRRVDLIGTAIFLLPTVGVIGWTTWDYVLRAWIDREASRQTGGLPYPFVPLLKTAILVAVILLAIQALAWMLRGGRVRSVDTPHGTSEL
ncbi:MAG: TRAP transporter small permease subunit [Gammaproteobacteria bacterium]